MLQNEEFLLGSPASRAASASRTESAGLRCRGRRSMQWLGVLLAHGAAIALVLHVSPQARSALSEVVHASLIPPRPLPVAPPPEPHVKPPEPPPKPPEPHAKPPEPRRKPVQASRPRPAPEPAPVLSVVPREEAPPASFVVEAPAASPAVAPQALAQYAPASPAVAAPAPAPPAPLIPPIYNADYLDNPPPKYPPISRRLGEQGRVLLRVRVSVNGRAERIEVRTSSGFERLDQAAQAAVTGWRFVPARRGEEPTAAWVLIPVSFVM